MKTWKSFKYKNISLFLISLVFAFTLSRFELFRNLLLNLGNFGYFGAFFAGVLFVSTFTVTTGAIVLFILAESLSPIEIGIIAGLGAVVGDFTIFRFVKDNLTQELELIYDQIDGNHHFKKVLHSKYFRWTFPVFGAIIIASPLPDELGVSLMGIAKMKTSRFLIFSFILNAIGIFLIISASLIINP